MMNAYTYAHGYASDDAAWMAWQAMCAEGEASPCELADIRSYKTYDGKRRWKIILKG